MPNDTPVITPQMMAAACGQYSQTITLLSARLADMAANLAAVQAENAALRARLVEQEAAAK